MTDPVRTVVITGATGNIGRKLNEHLKDRPFNLRRICMNPRQEPGVVTADLSAFASGWADHFAGADAVVHLAGDPRSIAKWDSITPNNIDVTINVFRAAIAHRVPRVIFASSIWAVAGYRHSTVALTSDLPPKPVNPYGASKLMGERLARNMAEEHGITAICLRIGACRHVPGNRPEDAARFGRWGQSAWLSDRDLCHAVDCSLTATGISFAVLNVVSDNPGSRWSIEETRRIIGFTPQDGYPARDGVGVRAQEFGAYLRDVLFPRLGKVLFPPGL